MKKSLQMTKKLVSRPSSPQRRHPITLRTPTGQVGDIENLDEIQHDRQAETTHLSGMVGCRWMVVGAAQQRAEGPINLIMEV
jgi:hypothetical protein